MIKKITLISFALLFSFFESFSQTNSNWNPIGLNVAGYNMMNGVEASYQLNTCSGEDVVFVKLVNHNAFTVTVEWYPAVFTQDHQWIKKETLADKKSVTLNPNDQLEGDCSGTKPEMIILLADFSTPAINFFRYGAMNFSVANGVK
jgi:hypothetical protein